MTGNSTGPIDLPPPECPLCGGRAEPFAAVRGRRYLHCRVCDLVHLDAVQRPSLSEERSEYLLHRNDPCDDRYRRHLQRLTEPLFSGMPTSTRALDYGCGPTASISVLMAERGFKVVDYDPLFRPILLKGHFDVIALSETAEHLHEPGLAFERLARLLAPRGRLGIMTGFRDPAQTFAHWHYLRERSHVSFFSHATMRWLAERHRWQVTQLTPRVAIFEARTG